MARDAKGESLRRSLPSFERLEERVLLDAGMLGTEYAASPDPSVSSHAVVVDSDEAAVSVELETVAPVLPGLKLVDPDISNWLGQIIYLDCDGADGVVYNGPATVGPLDILAFQAPRELAGQERNIMKQVLATLNETFANSGVTFTTDRPSGPSEYSTIYVGGDGSAFADYGSLLGLVEQVDVRNRRRGDEGLIFAEDIDSTGMDGAVYVSTLAHVIAHETGHLLGYAHADQSSREGPLAAVAHSAGPDDGESGSDAGPVHQWLTYNAYLFYDSQFAGSEMSTFIGEWTDYGSAHHRTNGDNNDVVEGAFDEDVSEPTTYIFDNGFHWDIVPQNPLGQDIPYYRHFVAGGDGEEIYDGWSSYASAVTQALAYWGDYVLDNYPTNRALSYYYLGHVAHLLEDMAVPAHVHNDAHPVRDAYEYTIGEHSNYLLWGYGQDTRTGPTGQIEMPSDLASHFRETIDYTEEYDSDDGIGDDESTIDNTGRHRPDLVSASGGFTGDGADLSLFSKNEISMLADDLMPWAIEQVSALFRLFYSYVDVISPKVELATRFGTSEETAVLKPSQFHIVAEASDDISGYNSDSFHFTVERKVGGSWELFTEDVNAGQFEFVTNVDGVFRIRAEVEDAAGNIGVSETGYFIVEQARTLAEVYRFWSPTNSRHFYTIDTAERDKLINNYAHIWTYEGVAFYAFATEAELSATAVFRFWSPSLNSHFYTTSQTERNKLIDLYSPETWVYEGVAFYTYAKGTQSADTYATYRFWSARFRTHFFTMSRTERDKLLDFYSDVWTYEGICWYAYMP